MNLFYLKTEVLLNNLELMYMDGWPLVKEAALTTVHKKYNGKEISSDWKLKILKAKHSPIREFQITYRLENIPRWVADQLTRHTIGVNPYMATARPDRKNKPRSRQSMEEPTNLMQTHNAESFINMCNQRLCIGCVSKETRLIVAEIVKEIEIYEPEIAFYCVPNCIKYCACKEDDFVECNHFKKFIKKILVDKEYDSSKIVPIIMDIKWRYSMYHKFMNR